SLLPCVAECLDLLSLLQVKGLVRLVIDQRRTLQVQAQPGRPRGGPLGGGAGRAGSGTSGGDWAARSPRRAAPRAAPGRAREPCRRPSDPLAAGSRSIASPRSPAPASRG